MPTDQSNFSRRDFLRQTALSGIALTIGAYLPAGSNAATRIINAALTDPANPSIELMSWISIDQTGKATLLNHRSEMGQGTWQSLPQIIAEELEISMDQVEIRFAPANPAKFGPQPQEGSFSVRGWYLQLLNAGASAREMLIAAGAGQWEVPPSECYAEHGRVIHRPTRRELGYGVLVEKASRLQPPAEVKLKHRKDYTLIGKALPRKDIPLKVNGSAIFGMDKTLPGMLYAVVLRNPRFKGRVKSFDAAATSAVPGVKKVFPVQRAVFGDLYEGVAVVADSHWAALQGRKLLKVEWDDGTTTPIDSEQLYTRMRQGLAQSSAITTNPSTPANLFTTALQTSSHNIEAIYTTPYQSHSCMEPLNCIANVQDDRIEIWGPIQEVNWIQSDLSERMGIPKSNVSVNMTFLGGGFGRKAFTDYPHEAALISREMKAPVRVIWTREDDMTAGPFRAGAMFACKGGLDPKGHIAVFQAIRASQSMGPGGEGGAGPSPLSYNSGYMDGLARSYLNSIPHYSFGDVGIQSPIPAMWWRSVDASTNGFAVESFIDELAHAAGKDPLAFRRDHFPDPRYQALLDRLEVLSGWKTRGKNAGWGVAVTECFGSIVAQAVKVSQTREGKLSKTTAGKIKIDKVIALIDCGWYVNPDIIRAQVEGAIVMGLGAAIKHETLFKDGKAVQNNFHTYKMPRINDIPPIEVFIMENEEKAGGVGEPGLPPFAPALCNAIFDLTGRRIRRLPFDLDAAGS